MIRVRMTCVLILLVLISGACNRSPEARRDRFIARGKAFLQKHDYSRAVVEFKNAAQATPKDAEPYYQIGVASFGGGDVRTAIVAFKKALEINPKHAGAQLRMAQLMANASEPTWLNDAENRLKSLMETSPVTPEILNTLALTEMRLGNTASAVENLEQALAKAPQELTSSILLAKAKLLQNDVKGAEDVLKKARDANPNSAASHTILGRFYVSRNRLADADGEFQNAIRINPQSGTALMDLATLQNSLGRKQEAEASFKRLAALGDKTYRPVYALFLFENGRRDDAVHEFEKLVKDDPEDRPTRTRLVSAYLAVNKRADAQKVLDQALKKNPRDLDALLQRGEMSLAAGKYSEAEADLNEVLHLQPSSAETHYLLGKLHQARGATLSYRQDLSKALQLNPYLLSVRLELAGVLTDTKEGQASLDILNEAPESQRELTPVLVQRNWALWALGDMAGMRKGIDQGLSRGRSKDLLLQDGLWKLRAGNPSGARAALEQALNIDPSDVRALSALNQTYAAQKQNAVALQKVKEYASRQPKSAPVQEYLGVLLMANGDQKQARAAFEAAKAADPKFVRADLSLVQTDVVTSRWDDAQKRLQAVLTSDPGNTTARLWLGNVEATKGDNKDALEQFRQVVVSDPSNPQALNNFAYLLAEYGNQPAEALKYAQKAKELAPDTAEYSDTLGWILYRKGLYPLAVTELERAVSKEHNPIWKSHLAMAYAKAGDLNRGRTLLEAVLKTNPNLPEAKTAQEMIQGVKPESGKPR
jgi:tetratricopeptide (TPR) repeat protein